MNRSIQDELIGNMDDHPSDRLKDLQHVAIIMDGNGRWAKKRGLPRTAGHKRGVETVKEIVMAASEFGLPYLTIFSFSSENWSRPKPEIDELMRLMKLFLEKEQEELHRSDIRVKMIGAPLDQTSEVYAMIKQAEEQTANNKGLQLTVAFNYGGRNEIVRAAQKLGEQVASGQLSPQDINEPNFEQALDTYGIPDPDLLIRTSGEYRISNFLLWQLAYTEFVFLDCNWPDFNRETLQEAMQDYFTRDRRFGGVAARTSI